MRKSAHDKVIAHDGVLIMCSEPGMMIINDKFDYIVIVFVSHFFFFYRAYTFDDEKNECKLLDEIFQPLLPSLRQSESKYNDESIDI